MLKSLFQSVTVEILFAILMPFLLLFFKGVRGFCGKIYKRLLYVVLFPIASDYDKRIKKIEKYIKSKGDK